MQGESIAESVASSSRDRPLYSGKSKSQHAFVAKNRQRKKKRSGAQRRRNALLRRENADQVPTETTVSSTETKESKKSYDPFPPTAIKLAVITDNFPTVVIAQPMVYDIQGLLIDEFFSLPKPLPVIEMTHVIAGALRVKCDGPTAVEFIKQLDHKIVNGITLRVVEAKDVPKPVKMAWKMVNDHKNDVEANLVNLQRLNPQLRTDQWTVMDTSRQEYRIRRIVLMNRMCADVIEKANYELPDGIDISKFKVLKSLNKNNSAPVTVPMETEATANSEVGIRTTEEGHVNSSLLKEDDVESEMAALDLSKSPALLNAGYGES